eukprot:GHVL01025963.1.p1 GENE.GHVL01025963.1~~GHVL01025963.1.p1  ORF type:complete len:136 (+),score=20.95 GHVL01025963.1:38-409(+)
MSIGVPVKLLYEGLGHVVTVETKAGNLLRGTLSTAEDNMNILIESVTVQLKDGKTQTMEQVYLRGSQIRFIIFPDMLKHAPMFKLLRGKGKALGLGGQKKAQAMRARAGTALAAARRGTLGKR